MALINSKIYFWEFRKSNIKKDLIRIQTDSFLKNIAFQIYKLSKVIDWLFVVKGSYCICYWLRGRKWGINRENTLILYAVNHSTRMKFQQKLRDPAKYVYKMCIQCASLMWFFYYKQTNAISFNRKNSTKGAGITVQYTQNSVKDKTLQKLRHQSRLSRKLNKQKLFG